MNWPELEKQLVRHLGPILVVVIIAGSSFLLGSSYQHQSTPSAETNSSQTTPTDNNIVSDIQQSLSTPAATNSDPTTSATDVTPSVSAGLVNINTGSAADLDKLPGIGAVKAQAIIDYRTQNGPFVTVDDLEKVKGIGPTTVQKLKSLITL